MIYAALSIARSLAEDLVRHPFSGWVSGRFERACNFIDAEGRVIALTLPEAGNGPFSIVVTGYPGSFDLLVENQAAVATPNQLNIGSWQVTLNTAKLWEAQIVQFIQPRDFNSAIIGLLTSYAGWPRPVGVNSTMYNRMVEVAVRLNQAILEPEGNKRSEKIGQTVGQLAGLGNGLTPAGDDYLVGVMAALWLTGQKEILPEMAQVAAPLTTTLSAAFLKAAARGEFVEPWHGLAQALSAGEVEASRQAIERVAQFGASSGRDALTGFAATVLGSVKPEALVQ